MFKKYAEIFKDLLESNSQIMINSEFGSNKMRYFDRFILTWAWFDREKSMHTDRSQKKESFKELSKTKY